jgi:hypothetical protein
MQAAVSARRWKANARASSHLILLRLPSGRIERTPIRDSSHQGDEFLSYRAYLCGRPTQDSRNRDDSSMRRYVLSILHVLDVSLSRWLCTKKMTPIRILRH